MSATGSRLIAREVVTRVREREAYAHETLSALLARTPLPPRDVSFATMLSYGCVAWRGTLDEVLDRYLTRPGSVSPLVRDCLVVSAFEILRSQTPHRAAVSQGVELVRSVEPRAHGLANAVLRRLAGDAADFPWGDATTDTAILARMHGHPLWLAQMWIDELGREVAMRIMEADDAPAPLCLAWNGVDADSFEHDLDALRSEGVEPSERWIPGCVVAGDAAAAVRSTALAKGRFSVMDAGAQFAATVVGAREGMHVAEIGAGRGTKSLYLACAARRGGGPARVVAVDVHGFKLARLADAARQRELPEIETVELDVAKGVGRGESGPLQPASFDAVLVDAPCSGLGTLRRHPDRRWRAQPHEIEALAELGSSLLTAAAALVRPGGFVVYSTCTVARRENQEVVGRFLESSQGAGFTTVSLEPDVPAEWSHFVTTEGWFQSLPEAGGPDGHFVARLRRG